MEQKRKETFAGIVCMVTAMILSLAAWGTGFAFGVKASFWKYLFLGGLCVLAAAGTVNAVRCRLWKKKMNGLTAQQMIDMGFAYKEQIEADYKRAEKNLDGLILRSRLWALFIGAVTAFVCFALGRTPSVSDGRSAGDVAVVILASYILSGVVRVFVFPASGEALEAGTEMRREAYPRLFKVTERAAGALDCKKRVRAFFTNDGFSVAERGAEIDIFVDPQEFALLTEEELYSVMLHEFAHVKNADTSKFLGYERACRGLSLDGGGLFASILTVLGPALFFGYYAERVSMEYAMLREFSSRRREILADDSVREHGLEQAYINATSKVVLLALYHSGNKPEMDYGIFSSEEPPEDYCARDLETFGKYLKKNEKLWNYILRHEIPARVDSHPTFRMRMEHMGVSDYDYTARENDPAYVEEQEKALWEAGLLVKKKLGPQYRDYREAYLGRKAKTDEYLKAEETGRELSVAELAGCADAFYGIDDERALAAAERLEAKQPDSCSAAFFKGKILADRGDEACVPLLYRAAESPDYAEAAVQSVGMFALKMGRQDILDDYRARVAGYMQDSMDRAKDVGLPSEKVLSPCDIPEELFKPLIEGLAAASGGEAVRIYAAKRRRADGKASYVYVVETRSRYSKKPADKEANKALYESWEEMYRYLQNSGLPEAYRDFSLYGSDAKKLLARMKKAVPGCRVYEAPPSA